MTEKEFTEGQEAIIEKMAYAVGDKIAVKLKEGFRQAVDLHQATCPTRVTVEATLNRAKGGLSLWHYIVAAVVVLAPIILHYADRPSFPTVETMLQAARTVPCPDCNSPKPR